jgi:hypothetical protein
MRGRKDDDSKDELRTVAVIASRQLNSEWLKLFRIGDCLMAAKYYLQRIVNEHLMGAASPQLLECETPSAARPGAVLRTWKSAGAGLASASRSDQWQPAISALCRVQNLDRDFPRRSRAPLQPFHLL